MIHLAAYQMSMVAYFEYIHTENAIKTEYLCVSNL